MKGLALVIASALLMAYASHAQQNECDYKVEIIANNSEPESGDFSFRVKATGIKGEPTNITGAAEIEDSKGEIIKKYKPWFNEPISRQKTSSIYKPSLKDGIYKITSRIDVKCNDINKGNNADSKTISINAKNENTNAIESTALPQNYTDDLEAEEDNEILLMDKAQNKSTNSAAKPEIVYKSSSEKAKGLIIIFLLALSILLNIILIWRR